MDTGNARDSIKKITTTATSLEPSVLITLFEIDISELISRSERVVSADPGENFQTSLRFHNNAKLIKSSIYFNNVEYFPAPIHADGFETSAKGSPATPKLRISISPEGLKPDIAKRIKYIKYAVRDLDDLSGAKVTRIRTFAKYLDCQNWYTNCTTDGVQDDVTGTGTELYSNTLTAPEGFDPDPFAYFPPDIYFIDRKSGENKGTIEFELASPFDLQELKLPGRIVTENNCTWFYRGEGCCYEYDNVKQKQIGGIHYSSSAGECKSVTASTGAPSKYTSKDEDILTVINKQDPKVNQITNPEHPNAPKLWSATKVYPKGEMTRVNLKGVNYYFVSKKNGNKGKPPPNSNHWCADECSKTLTGCTLRWTDPLPIGAFPTSRRGGTS